MHKRLQAVQDKTEKIITIHFKTYIFQNEN